MHGLGAPGRGDSRAQEIVCEVVEAPGGGCPPSSSAEIESALLSPFFPSVSDMPPANTPWGSVQKNY